MLFYFYSWGKKKKKICSAFPLYFQKSQIIFFRVINSSSPGLAKPLFCNRDFPLGYFSLKQVLCQEPRNWKVDHCTPPAGPLSLTTPPLPTERPGEVIAFANGIEFLRVKLVNDFRAHCFNGQVYCDTE